MYITESLEKILAPLDEKVLISTQQWAKNRAEKLRQFYKSDEYISSRTNTWNLYRKLYLIAGGQTWYAILKNTDTTIETLVIEHCKKVANNRNIKIKKRLIKEGITDVVSEQITHSSDGFNGVFVVNTDAGIKTVTIETIYAGGHNVQCLHLRVLVKIT